MLCSDCIIHKSNKMWFKFMAFVFLKTTFEISIITEMNIQNRIKRRPFLVETEYKRRLVYPISNKTLTCLFDFE